MGQYKVPQNVEAEDKILGPLSLRQFIYVIIALMWGFVMWRIFSNALPIAILLILPVSGTFLALGLIQREEQSFENYFVAMVRFVIVPRKRVWHKDDVRDIFKKEVVSKKPELTMSSRNPELVRGQLQKLALVVATRGRAAKSAAIQLPDEYNQAAAMSARINSTASAATAEINQAHVTADDDILDMQNSKQAAAVGQLLENVEANIRRDAVTKMNTPVHHNSNIDTPNPSSDSSSQKQDGIMDLALNGGNLSVAQISKSANRANGQLQENQAVSLR